MRMQQIRSSGGFSLATALVIGLVASMTLAGLYSLIMPSFTRVSQFKTQTALRNAAEAGLDWAVAQYNMDGGVAAGFELAGANYQVPGHTTTVNVPANVVNPNNNSFTPAVQVISMVSQPPGPNPGPRSGIYDSTRTYPGPNFANGIMYRVLTASASSGAGLNKAVQVVIAPNPPPPGFKLAPIKANQYTKNGAGNSFDTNAVDTSKGNPNQLLNAGGDIDVNSAIDLSGQKINGNVTCRMVPSGTTAATGVTVNSSTTVTGIIQTSGAIADGGATINGIEWKDPTDTSQGTQTVGTKKYQQTTVGYGGVSLAQTSSPMPVVPTTAPANATPLAPVSGSTTIGASGTKTIYSINTNNGTAISLAGQNALTAAGPTEIWLTGAAGTMISCAGKSTIGPTSGKPADLIIYYGGAGNLDMRGCNAFTGVIIAPKATVTFGGNAAILGAVVGNVIVDNGGGNSGHAYYDMALNNLNLFPGQTSYSVNTWREGRVDSNGVFHQTN